MSMKWIFIPVLILVVVLGSGSAEAQIVNTLRGFDEDESGWSGELEVRFAQSGGNTDVLTFGAGAQVQWQGERQRVRALGAASRSESDEKKTAESSMLHLRHNYDLRTWLASLLFAQVQENPFQRLQLRRLLGAGARFDVIDAEDWALSLGAAHMFEREEIEDDEIGAGGTSNNQRLSVFVTCAGDLTENLSADVVAFYQPLWSDFEDSRATSQATLRLGIVGSLELVLRGSVEHDARPPAGVEETDWSYRTALSLGL